MTLDRSMDNNSVSSDSTQGDDSQQEVRTLFVSGLPMDTKPREIYLMFRSYSGYQGSLLKLTGKEGKKATPVAFVTFENREQAEVCKAELQGIRFDPELPTSIRIEFAKANTKVTKPVLIRPPSISGTTIIPGPGFPGFELTPGIFTPDMQWPQNTNFVDINGNHTALQHLHPGITTLPLVHSPLLAYISPLDRFHALSLNLSPNNSGSMPDQAKIRKGELLKSQLQIACDTNNLGLSSTVNMPSHSPLIGNPMLGLDHHVCTTLFVANLGYNTTEDELKNMFGRIPSFRRLKMLRNKGTTPVSFVEYSDVIGALHAKNIFHGAVLLTSENGGIRIEFARNKMGESGKKNDLSYDIQVQG